MDWSVLVKFLTFNNILITVFIGLVLGALLLWKWGWHKPAKKVSAADVAKQLPQEATKDKPPEGRYPALIITEVGDWYFGKIPKPLGHIFVCDTTMPETGDHYLVKKIAEGVYEAYDPRTAPIVSNTTPEKAYRKTQDWEDDIPYIDDMGLLEKLPAIMAYCLIGLTVLAVLVQIGK